RASYCCGEGNGNTVATWRQGTRHNSDCRALAYSERAIQCARVTQVVGVTRVDAGDGMIPAKQCRRGVCCNAPLTSRRCASRHNIDACRCRLFELCAEDRNGSGWFIERLNRHDRVRACTRSEEHTSELQSL